MDLHLNLKREYFEAIKNGKKRFEFRIYNDFWKKRLIDKPFDRILIKAGYPKSTDTSKIIIRKWQGYEVMTINHPFFGPKPVKVFAIRV